MKTTKKQVSARVFKKLSALRATMSNEERVVLDNLIGASEVSAHKMEGKIATKTNPKISGKITGKISGKVSEVSAHKMDGKIATKTNPKISGKITAKSTPRIAFDPGSEEYKITE